MTPSLEIGNGNWAVQSDSLLGYKTINGKYYPREMSVTRATTATRVNPDGLVELVPYNLLQYSEDFSNVIWVKTQSTISANSTTSPSGLVNADTLTGDGVTAQHFVYQLLSVTSGVSYTMSTYTKKNTNNFVQIAGGSVLFGANAWANFDLNSGVVGSVGSAATATITNVGNGWYRCTMTAPAIATISGLSALYVLISSATSLRAETNSLSTSVFLWGAQLVEGTQALNYLPTTDRLDIARVDYSLGQANLLLEPQRTNVCLWSEQFDQSPWTVNSIGITINNTTAPSGLLTAEKIRVISGQPVGSSHIQQNISKAASALAYSCSAYFKAAELNSGRLFVRDSISAANNANAQFNLSTGVISIAATANGTFSSASATITNVGNGWYRCTLNFTSSTDTVLQFRIGTADTIITTGNGIDGIFVWGAQLELGAYSTSYIPTTSTSVTRNADVISKTGISSLIGQTEGTMFVDFIYDHSETASAEAISISDGTSANRIFLGNVFSNTFSATVTTSSFAQFTSATSYSLVVGQRYKVAIAYKANDFAFYVNGVQISSGTSGSVPATSRFAFDSGAGSSIFFKPTNAVSLFPTRLTNTQCINLTTI
jgi:hypothetical protein